MTDPDITLRVGEIMPAGIDPAALLESRRERERLRKREARKRQTPAHRERDRLRKQEARNRRTTDEREREKVRERGRDRKKIWPFMAIDGEGGGTDHLGRQNYLLMVAAGIAGEEYVLQNNGKPLLVRDCLEFILSLPKQPFLVAFGLGYDATQILRGISVCPRTC